MKYVDANNKTAPHPKQIEYLKKAIEIDSTLREPYDKLAGIYMGYPTVNTFSTYYHDFSKAIPYYEKRLSFYEIPDQELLKKGLDSYLKEINGKKYSPAGYNLSGLVRNYASLYYLYKATGDVSKSDAYLSKLTQKVEMINSVSYYMGAASALTHLLIWEENVNEEILEKSLDFQQLALKKANEGLKVVTAEEKPLLSLKYRELLKGVGATHRALKNYTEAENYLQQALAYPAVDLPAISRLKFGDSGFYEFPNRSVTVLKDIFQEKNGDYLYPIDAYSEMFFLRWEQNKPEEAFEWLEKAFQNSVEEHGNDVSGRWFEAGVLRTYPTLDQARFKALKAKYFPPTSTEKK